MKKKKINKKLSRFLIWSRLYKLHDLLEPNEIDLDDTSKIIIKVFTNTLHKQDAQLLKVVIGEDTFYEIHDNNAKIYLSLLSKVDGCSIRLLEFPSIDRKITELKSNYSRNVATRLIQSFQTEVNNRSTLMHEEFIKCKTDDLHRLYSGYESIELKQLNA